MNTKKQITRRDFLKGAAIAGMGTLVAASAGPAAQTAAPAAVATLPPKDKLRVGMSRPLSGWNAVIGDSVLLTGL